jgi:hypothetical protein
MIGKRSSCCPPETGHIGAVVREASAAVCHGRGRRATRWPMQASGPLARRGKRLWASPSSTMWRG